ncbi:MAG: PASTA domain-containing protein [Clostridia bacterium]|nr:PASTA domain-containing protein [Clostridia bacterium]
MKYRIIAITQKKSRLSSATLLKLCGYRAPKLYRSIPQIPMPPILFSELFAFGNLFEPRSAPCTPSLYRKAIWGFRRVMLRINNTAAKASKKVGALASAIAEKLRKRRERLASRKSSLPILLGALCASLAVAILCATVAVYELFISDHSGRYRQVSVPDMVGLSYPSDEAFSQIDYCNLTVKYEYDPNIPEGVVISQSPAAGAIRRVYPHKTLCNVSLTVSLGERSFTMNDYSSFSLREALLELKNEAVRVKVIQSYSDKVEAGRIISTTPSVGEIFSPETTVILCVSLGPETVYTTVPSLVGLNEIRAEGMIKAAGLAVGEVTYVSSDTPAGIVIAQSHTAYSSLPEGTAISLTVSAGQKYNEKIMPDLYGLSIDEARERLSSVGLVCGNIYAVSSGATYGVVVAQSIVAGVPIPVGTVSVDIYVSS